jgi:hypothetical protein
MIELRNRDGSLLGRFSEYGWQAVCSAYPRVRTLPKRQPPSDQQVEDRRAREGRVGNE